MNSRRTILLGALLATIAFAGCATGLPEDVAKLGYVSRDNRFAMDVPPGWKVRESGGPAAVIVRKPAAEGRDTPNIDVVAENHLAGAPLAEWVRLSKSHLADLPGFKLISEGPATTADGRQAWTITFRQDALGRPVQQRQLYVLAAERAYIVTATAAPETFAEEEPDFDICFRSFRAGW